MTPFNYYQEIKTEKIKEKLCDRNLTIAEAFSACGVDYKATTPGCSKRRLGKRLPSTGRWY
jgi:hypothetical protein